MRRYIIPVTAIVVLLVVDWLAFHDLFEPHTVRDYLTLAGSLLVFGHFAVDFLRGKDTPRLIGAR